MGIEKYRVHEVAKDFGLPTKTITEILTKYAETPKNHMQALTDQELSLIFEYLTQHNQVSSIQTIFADTYKDAAKEAPAKKAEPAKSAAPGQGQGGSKQPAAKVPQNAQGGRQPAQQQAGAPAAAKPAAQQPVSRVPQRKIVDTRKGGDVNLAKYDERLEDLGGERGARMQRQQRSGKEKIRTNNQRRGGMTFSNKRKQDEAERMRRLQLEIAKKAPVKVMIPDEISVGELASRMKKTGAEVVKCLMKNGVMASLSQIIDFDTAAIIAEEMGCKVEHEVTVTIEERLIDDHEDKPEDLVPRAPVVVVMGHVDHGKTSLLDTIRHTSVAAGEAGGITQHIGAYQVQVNGKPITFLDTPGHEAFTSMRARGAMITDIAILVVAADDGIMPQTVESINHAKAANIPIIVAINKIDKENANPDRVLQQLTEYGLVPEDWGGDTICCKISAKQKIGIENLLEMVTLTAEMAELKANPNRSAKGTVIEARLDKGRGPVATLLVQNGTLKQGDIIIAGTAVGRVRTMMDFKGTRLTEAGPSVPVEIAGLSEAPEAGSPFFAVADERMARELVEQRKAEARAKAAAPVQKVSLENLFDQIQAGERKELALIVKADVQGSVEAVKASLEKLSNDEVSVRVIHGGVGAINESDVMLAASSGAIIVGFNVRPDAAARDGAARQNVDMRMYRVIYDCIDEIEAAMKGMLAPKYREVVLGHAEVRQTYKVSSVGTVAGCYVQDGKIVRACSVRVVRDGIVIHEGSLASLKRFKDDAREVAENYECGLTVEKFNDIKEGDIIEAFTMEEIPR
ncbi:translation initiation factor IF-2 [Oscillibacter valericigenes]|uniref:Translation initiation factor IF-2 n=1 Tax=Oscillibacter valericigenes TaxID=351091 RepID=A0ABS2FZ20_9FIRM|nr:translation initiation factor IF-2 [Oscillibacter valericigenes]MBM6852288.1 translation initiation factor IF-2 [Oscillibacter valericigenes]MBM6910610.1 translation initiation factor IF-2 [Oscillibacter valericigenes]HJB76565.1 translation initiation factor IF-2 [Candidatus Oscillibacter avistercoris]